MVKVTKRLTLLVTAVLPVFISSCGGTAPSLPDDEQINPILTLRVPTPASSSGGGVPVTGTVSWTPPLEDASAFGCNSPSNAEDFTPANIGPVGQPMWVVDVQTTCETLSPAVVGHMQSFGVSFGQFETSCETALTPGVMRVNFTLGSEGCEVGLGNFP